MIIMPIPGYPGYFAKDDGTIWSRYELGSHKVVNKLRQKTPADHSRYGHQQVSIVAANGKKYRRYVHDLLLLTFCGPMPNGQECRHLDGNPRNNTLENLRWGTHKENGQDTIRHGTKDGELHGMAKLTDEQVIEMRQRRASGEKQVALANKFGITKQWASKVINHKAWTHI